MSKSCFVSIMILTQAYVNYGSTTCFIGSLLFLCFR